MRFGISLSPQATTWPDMLDAARLVDRLGYDDLFTWDHLLSPFGAADQPIFESWSILAAIAQHTQRVRVGTLVSANTFRHPALLAKLAVTLDHVSGARAILGIGAGWHEREHVANGIPYGRSVGQRLDWLEEALPIIRNLMSGLPVASAGDRYPVSDARHAPRPLQPRLPILIGGWGERRTLPIVAAHADIWNAKGSPTELERKVIRLEQLCRLIGRDPTSIERSLTVRMVIRDRRDDARGAWARQLTENRASRVDEPDPWLGTPEDIIEWWRPYDAIGFRTLVVSALAPFDSETFERLIADVAPAFSSHGRPTPSGGG